MEPTPCLYARLLGSAWRQLPEEIRRVHLQDGKRPASGSAVVVTGKSLLARILVYALRLPASPQSGPVELTVTRIGTGERWQRSFMGREVITFQREGPGRSLIERFGVCEFRFRLELEVRILYYRQIEFGLRLGRFFIPCPTFISPRVFAQESAKPEIGGVSASVRISLPAIGVLSSYDVELQVLE